jgi:hypothetical protein
VPFSKPITLWKIEGQMYLYKCLGFCNYEGRNRYMADIFALTPHGRGGWMSKGFLMTHHEVPR